MIIGITGANGFIGRYVTEQLAASSKYKLVVVIRSSDSAAYFRSKGVSVLVGDLREQLVCQRLVDQVDCVLHLAHSNSPLAEVGDLAAASLANLTPSLNLLEAVGRSRRPVRLIYASSGGTVYGSTERRAASETDICQPISPYGIEKLTIEHYIRYCAKNFDFGAVILRIANPYGVLLDSKRKQGLIGVALNRMLHDEVVQIYGNPENTRDYLHLDDLVRAFESALLTDLRGEIINIGSGVGCSVNEILDKLDEFMAFPSRREYLSNPQAGNLCDWSVLNISKAQKLLAWAPKIDLDQGLMELCQSAMKDGRFNK